MESPRRSLWLLAAVVFGSTLASLGVIGNILAGVNAPTRQDRLFLHLNAPEIVAGGQAFGAAGPYERITGSVDLWLDPGNLQNGGITDLSRAPRNALGLVEASFDVYLLRPVDLGRWSGDLVFEVNNRGSIVMLNSLDQAPWLNDPQTFADFGDGMLMRQGYALAWAGWEGDVLPGNHRLTARLPVAQSDQGRPLTQRISVEFHDRYFASNGPTTCLPLSGSPDFASYPVAEGTEALATMSVRPSDSDHSGSAGLPAGTPIARDQWTFRDPTTVCLNAGFHHGQVYELSYVARDPRVMGIGYAITRDIVSFLRRGGRDDAGESNPLPAVRHTLGVGISSSAMYLRDFIYQGFNQDLRGGRVFDGVLILGAGAQKLGLNIRFAQPNPYSTEHADRFLPAISFPFSFGVRENPLVRQGRERGPLTDGILKRAGTDPLVIQADTSTEYRQFQASLVDTDGFGHDVPLPPTARHYLIAGVQHGGLIYGLAQAPICGQPINTTYAGPAVRALFTDLAAWVDHGVPPPASRRPTVANGLLVEPTAAAPSFALAAGLAGATTVNPAGEPDLGPLMQQNAGVLASAHPYMISTYRVLLPKPDGLGVDQGGVAVPVIGVPTAIATGWNVRRDGDGLCDLNGMLLRLPASSDGGRSSSLPALYESHAAYVGAVEAFTASMVRARLLLPVDAQAAVERAKASDVLSVPSA